MIQITVGDNTYNSISAAWRGESPDGLPMITVRWRIKNGWTTWSAFKIEPVDPEFRRIFKEQARELPGGMNELL